MRTLTRILTILFVISTTPVSADDRKPPRQHDLTAKETLQAARMNEGDTLRFKLKNGQTRSFVLEKASARIVERPTGGIVYSFECRFLADGQPLTLRRYVCSQETFYEPWVINGVRLWLSSSASVFKLVPIRYPEDHDKFDADAVVVVQDATLPICPESPRPWFPLDKAFIDVGTCYNGDDPFLGPYLGQACHVGLDINMRKGTPLFAPIRFDDQWIFSGGHRWRGIRKWPNGEEWILQSHHVEKLLIKENTPVMAGTHYAEAAGKGVGSHQHSHFEFHLGPLSFDRVRSGGTEIDPWIFFWQIFENDKASKKSIHAEIAPLSPAIAGKPVSFSAAGSRPGKDAPRLKFFWTFGDGSASASEDPVHAFARPGVYPVTLIVDDSQTRATRTQHITVNGDPQDAEIFVLDVTDNPSFRPRPTDAADVYGWPVRSMPHTLRFAVRPGDSATPEQIVRFKKPSAELFKPDACKIAYLTTKSDWLVLKNGDPKRQDLLVSCNPQALPVGRHEAVVTCHSHSPVLNTEQSFRVELTIRPFPEGAEVIVDDADPGFEATPYAWVGHQFLRCPQRGYQKRYLTNGGLSSAAITARFTPDLAAGDYEVLLHPQTPLPANAFPIRIRHAKGEETITFNPKDKKSPARSLGVFPFAEGMGGFVELFTDGAQGPVIADAIVFRKAKKSP